jgi:hypothetical protein
MKKNQREATLPSIARVPIVKKKSARCLSPAPTRAPPVPTATATATRAPPVPTASNVAAHPVPYPPSAPPATAVPAMDNQPSQGNGFGLIALKSHLANESK